METSQTSLSLEAQLAIVLFDRTIDATTDIEQLRVLAKDVHRLLLITRETTTQMLGKQWGIIP